jgi:PIN domain nuclease of toxin-antitoxin system
MLAVLLEEPGAEKVERLLESSLISTVNVSEVLATAVERGLMLETVMPSLARLPMKVIAFDAEQAYIAASFRPATRSLGLSIGDRACLALGFLMKLPVLTADRVWAKADVGVEIDLIR